MEKTVTIDGKPVRLRCTAALPRLYRAAFGRDFFGEITAIAKLSDADADDASDKKRKRHKNAHSESRTVSFIENLAFLMARSADPHSVPSNIETWLDSFEDPNAIINAADEIISLYQSNNRSTVAQKKKNAP